MQNKCSYILLQKYMLRICDQTSIVQQPLEKNEKCIEIPALIITILDSERSEEASGFTIVIIFFLSCIHNFYQEECIDLNV